MNESPWRIPVLGAVATAALTAVAMVLDTGGERARDLALLIGAPTLWVLLPATVAAFGVALVVHVRRRR